MSSIPISAYKEVPLIIIQGEKLTPVQVSIDSDRLSILREQDRRVLTIENSSITVQGEPQNYKSGLSFVITTNKRGSDIPLKFADPNEMKFIKSLYDIFISFSKGLNSNERDDADKNDFREESKDVSKTTVGSNTSFTTPTFKRGTASFANNEDNCKNNPDLDQSRNSSVYALSPQSPIKNVDQEKSGRRGRKPQKSSPQSRRITRSQSQSQSNINSPVPSDTEGNEVPSHSVRKRETLSRASKRLMAFSGTSTSSARTTRSSRSAQATKNKIYRDGTEENEIGEEVAYDEKKQKGGPDMNPLYAASEDTSSPIKPSNFEQKLSEMNVTEDRKEIENNILENSNLESLEDEEFYGALEADEDDRRFNSLGSPLKKDVFDTTMNKSFSLVETPVSGLWRKHQENSKYKRQSLTSSLMQSNSPSSIAASPLTITSQKVPIWKEGSGRKNRSFNSKRERSPSIENQSPFTTPTDVKRVRKEIASDFDLKSCLRTPEARDSREVSVERSSITSSQESKKSVIINTRLNKEKAFPLCDEGRGEGVKMADDEKNRIIAAMRKSKAASLADDKQTVDAKMDNLIHQFKEDMNQIVYAKGDLSARARAMELAQMANTYVSQVLSNLA